MKPIKQSVCWWCFTMVGLRPEQLLRAAADIGYAAVELVEPEHWSLVKEYGLTIAAINGGLSIEQELNRREHHASLEQRIRTTIRQSIGAFPTSSSLVVTARDLTTRQGPRLRRKDSVV